MYFNKVKLFLVLVVFICGSSRSVAQQKVEKKYPSLLWEITGNGLKKPSYLFGTMHISSKMVFHLSDSFFIAIKNSDVVGLELNSETWQQEMMAMEKQKASFDKFYNAGSSYNDYSGSKRNSFNYVNEKSITENSFRLENSYVNFLRFALQESPYIINSLLYRSYDYKQDFEENTFLDMYIYQTGKRLGKKSAGMETIFTMEKYTTEAEIDRAKEKKKKYKPKNYDNMPEMSADEAYRKGDLDMLDSIDRMYNESEAFIEKFLYQRNDVQAHSMDTIMQKGQSLFVGVGAAHLPGKRGVIEILRKMGYKLRPIKMQDRDAAQREKVDKIRVPVSFIENTAPDNFYKVKVPGKLYERLDGLQGMSMQYADMSNGAYYMVTRVPTLSTYFNLSEQQVYKTIDSLLYENVPGKILKKEKITRNGYLGIALTNKTRRGDIQRYNIFITPYEAIIFKMSGNEAYVENGPEANTFFNSIILNSDALTATSTQQVQLGNISVQVPASNYNKSIYGNTILFAKDKQVNYYLKQILVSNGNFTPTDTFSIMLMEESFIGKKKNYVTLNRKFDFTKPYTCMNALYIVADSTVMVKYIVNGNQHIVLAAQGINKNAVMENTVLPSFTINYTQPISTHLYEDTFMKFSVSTPYKPILVDSLKKLLFELKNTYQKYRYSDNEPQYNYREIDREMVFSNDTTGEKIIVALEKSGRYEYWHDSLYKRKLFRDSLEKAFNNPTKLANYLDSFYAAKYPSNASDGIVKKYIVKQNWLERKNGYSYFKEAITDTGSTKLIRRMEIAKDDVTYTLTAETDTTNSSTFINTFFNTFTPLPKGISFQSKYGTRVDTFFADYYSRDTIQRKIARSAIYRFDFQKQDIPKMLAAYHSLNIKDKDYFETKTKWLNAITNMADSTNKAAVLDFLKTSYEKTTDTSIFQNTILSALVRLNTKESYQLFKQYLLQDPPVLDGGSNSYDYDYYDGERIAFFGNMDSLELTKTLFPDILQLTNIPEYKEEVMHILETLIDSSKITAKDYESFSTKLLFDAKLLWKKQQLNDQKKVKETLESEETDMDDLKEKMKIAIASIANKKYSGNGNSSASELLTYVKLLLPFYETNTGVANLIQKLWQTKDEALQYQLFFLMLKANKPYPDTLINHFTQKEINRGDLYYKLAKLKKEHLFPKQYATQAAMANAFIYTNIDTEDKLDSADKKMNFYNYERGGYTTYPPLSGLSNYSNSENTPSTLLDSVVLLKKEIITINKKEGYVYVYKYRKDKEDKWRFAYSGLQPKDGTSISYKNYITALTNEKLVDDEPLEKQIALLLKKLRFKKNEWSSDFYNNEDGRGYQGEY